jgi:hypothetical protein
VSRPPRDGRDGRDGKDADEEKIVGEILRRVPQPDVAKIVQEVLRRVPTPKDGANGLNGKDSQPVQRQKWEANFVKDQYDRTAYVDVVPSAGGPAWRITPKHQGDMMYFAEITPL